VPFEPPEAASLPVLDEARVNGLRDLGPGVLGDIARLWLDTAPAALERLRVAVAGGDATSAGAAAHTLRGSAANLGAEALAAAAGVAEDAARLGTRPLGPLAERVEREFARLVEAMKPLAAGGDQPRDSKS